MSTPPDVLWVFDNETDGKTFERLCVDLLGRNGYAAIVPFGGMRDHARDAEMTSYTGRSRSSSLVFFQFSLEASWQRKLRAEAEKICKCGHLISELIFVTSRGVTGETRDKLKQEFKGQYGWELTILPEQLERDSLPSQLFMNLGPRRNFLVRRRLCLGDGAAHQLGQQLRIRQSFRQRPGQPGDLGPLEIITHRANRQAAAAGDFAHRQLVVIF